MKSEKFSFKAVRPRWIESKGDLQPDEKDYLDQTVEAYKRGEVVEFFETIHKDQWCYFNEKTKGIKGKVELNGPLQSSWPVDEHKQISVFVEYTYNKVVEVLTRRNQYPFQYKRKVSNLDKHFLVPYGSKREHERECMMQTLERLNVLDNSIYSRPKPDKTLQKHVDIGYTFPIRNENVKYRNIEGTNVHLAKQKYLYSQDKMLPALYDASKRVHCFVVLDNFPFNNELNMPTTEKFLWPVFFGVPFIYIGSEHQKESLRSWGFEPNDQSRTDVRSTTEQMMSLKSIFDDPKLAQQWQDSQGDLVIKNWKALQELPNKLRSV